MDPQPARQRSDRWLDIAAWALPPGLVLLFAWLAVGGFQWPAHLPFEFSGDSMFYLAQSKSTLDHGWWWNNPSIGAPIGLHAAAFAQNTNVDQAIVRIVGLFTHEVGLAVNMAWLIMLALSAVTTTWGLRRLGVSRVGAGVAGVLFAVSPFAILRNTGHFNLVTYLLPFPATVGVLLASFDRERPWRGRDLAVPMAGCALVGFNYIYFAFFGAFVIGVGALVGAARIRSIAPVKVGGLCLGVLMLTTAMNTIPNVLAWQQYGPPAGVAHVPVESEIYGLKIRHLVSPIPNHWFPPFKTWLDLDKAAHFSNENENTFARLGVIASAGFLGLIAALIFPAAAGRDASSGRLRAAAVLTVAVLLLGTVGGFGSLFSLLVSPDIRTYNRVSSFIAFFALAGVALWGDRVTAARPSRLHAGFWVVLLCAGLADQQPAFRRLVADLPVVQTEFGSVAAFTSALEARLADQAMVYQLPVRPYPADSGIERLGVYDQFRPYLTTRRLRWSYPALTNDQLVWERAVGEVAETDLPRYLAREGFSAILISRAGYADRGRRLVQALQDASAGATLIASNDDYAALDLRPLRTAGAR